MSSQTPFFIGKVDRLSGSGNAIVQPDDIKVGPKENLNSEVNLGELPQKVAGETVVFVYNTGTFGICITKHLVTEDYLTEMQAKTGVSIDSIEDSIGIGSQDRLENLQKELLITVSSPLHHESIVYEGRKIENAVIVQSVGGDEGSQYLLAVMNGPLMPMGGTPVTVTGREGQFITVESCFTAANDEHPSLNDEIMVNIVEKVETGCIGITKAHIPVFVSTGQYQVGNELRVTVTEETESHFVGKTVLDVYQDGIGVDELDSVFIENRAQNRRIICNGMPIDVVPVRTCDLEPERLVVTGKNDEAIEARWDLLSTIEDEIPIQVGDKITFEIKDTNYDMCVGTYHGYPVVCSGVDAFPPECENKKIRGMIEKIEPDIATVSLLNLPENSGKLKTEILGLHRQNGIAVFDGYLVRLPDASFVSVGDEVSVKVTKEKGDITEVSASECLDVNVGDEIILEIGDYNGDLIGYYQNLPVICAGIGAFSDECKGKEIRVQIKEKKSDRLIVSLAHIPKTDEDIHVEIVGQHGKDAFGISEGYLIKLPTVDVVSRGDVLVAAVSDHGDPITEVSVAARSFLRANNNLLLVRLPKTTGGYTIIDGLPIKTRHLPDIDSPVTLGVSDVNTDSVVPSVTALPESHIPDFGDRVATTIMGRDDAFAIGVGEELPIESPSLIPVESDKIKIQISNVARDRLSGVAVGAYEQDIEQFDNYYVCLQIAELAYREEEYEKAHNMLMRAHERLPIEELLFDSVLTAHTPLIKIISESDISEIDIQEIENERKQFVKLREEIEETDAGDEIRAYLKACNLELKAVQSFIGAANEATQDSRSSLQSIARGYDSKDKVMEGVTHVDRAKSITSKTGFNIFVPSNELRMIVEDLRNSYPVSVDELDHIPEPQPDTNWLSYFVSGGDTEISKGRLSKTNDDSEVWTRPVVPAEFGVCTVESSQSISSMETKIDGLTGKIDDKQASSEKIVEIGENNRGADQSEYLDSNTLNQINENQASGPQETKSKTDIDKTSDDSDMSAASADSTTDKRSDEVKSTPQSESRTELRDTDSGGQDIRTDKEIGTIVDSPDVDEDELAATPVPDIKVTEELRELRLEAEKDATENPSVESSETSDSVSRAKYVRSAKIRRYARVRADGMCEFCGNRAPFIKPDGDPYLEVHHVDELGDGGADDPSFVAALCPSCHMEIHYGRRGRSINQALREKLKAGLGDIGAAE